ncbi:hypothetical protein IMSHALPRED_000881 [Imshaugia aleurites]|uniref:Uncharacterized protein n=1 Tax=Imshaugia aleurites TaxID=172621 RepID=A0A8H3IEJ9_9LECA|nr:hypothetical protein IMSHALPRED_000881 [Imshaugia aleurites]
MEPETSRRRDAKAGCLLPRIESARLDRYTILELARLPSVTKEVMVEDWLESVYGKTTAPVRAPSAEFAPTGAFGYGSGILFEARSTRDHSPSEGPILASRPPTTTETSVPCDVDTTFIERKMYKWRKWATESV